MSDGVTHRIPSGRGKLVVVLLAGIGFEELEALMREHLARAQAGSATRRPGRAS